MNIAVEKLTHSFPVCLRLSDSLQNDGPGHPGVQAAATPVCQLRPGLGIGIGLIRLLPFLFTPGNADFKVLKQAKFGTFEEKKI